MNTRFELRNARRNDENSRWEVHSLLPSFPHVTLEYLCHFIHRAPLLFTNVQITIQTISETSDSILQQIFPQNISLSIVLYFATA